MSGNNYREHPFLKEIGVIEEYKIKASETSMKMFWFNAGFVEGTINEGAHRKLSETGVFCHVVFPNTSCIKFAIYWFKKGREYSELWNRECFDKRLKKI
jgi:hypothetical protein